MKVNYFIEMELINDYTKVSILDGEHILAQGNWYQDDILYYVSNEVKLFIWSEDNSCCIFINR
ncbi:MAG: hypothetical protein K2H41_12595 [Acetatifactor sp.]|nr:hypothetical protein [Acetatifactor sp.]